MTKLSTRGKLCSASLLFVGLAACGCQMLPDRGLSCSADQVISTGFNRAPRMRWGAYPAAILGTPWVGPNLGTHSYYGPYPLGEKDGIAYTCRGGTIDVAHLRIAADWTAYLTARTYRRLLKNDQGFTFKLAVDRSREYVQFTYPTDWNSRSEAQRKETARQIALAVGPYLAYTMTTWHEVLTWFGFKCAALPTEFPSAFSWEDSYSNLLGTIIAVQALQDTQHPYNEAVRIALDREMARLGIQPAEVARRVTESVRGPWYTGGVAMLLTLRKRNFDIGLGDGLVTPSLIPNLPPCPGAEPISYPAPNLAVLAQHGFALTLEIEPHEWESGKILRVVYGDKPKKRVNPVEHFPIVMNYIRQAAQALYPEFDYTAYEDGSPPQAIPTHPQKD